MKLESLVQYLDDYLQVGEHPDYPVALNGLQVEGRRDVSKVAAAVDASAASIRAAAEAGADLLIVHHGLFWDGLRPVTGRRYRRLAALLEAGLALYSCHLPLDGHPGIGNAALLAGRLGVQVRGPFGSYEGVSIGCWGTLPKPLDASELTEALRAAVDGDVRALAGGPDRITKVGVVTGGGASFIRAAVDEGLDALVTGEASHHHYFDAAELGIHVLLGGHYATETFGIRALADHLADRFGLEAVFIDQPTGL